MNDSNRRTFLQQSFAGAFLLAPSMHGLIERARLAALEPERIGIARSVGYGPLVNVAFLIPVA